MRRRYLKQKINIGRTVVILILAVFYIIYIFFERQISDGITDITILKAEELCTRAVNSAVIDAINEGNYNYDDFANIYTNEKTVMSISTNSVNTNKFKATVSLKAQEAIGEMSGMSINYNLGDFFGSQLFASRGPDVVVKLSFSASVLTDMHSSFESCGLNQTKHTLDIIVTSKVYITSDDDFETYTTVVTTVPVAENIIIGDIPSVLIEK